MVSFENGGGQCTLSKKDFLQISYIFTNVFNFMPVLKLYYRFRAAKVGFGIFSIIK